ncbi:MAG: PDZ domain-containing protein, partial [Pyrinomonadaceae bacterium]|nr:PDZ domain-containing protein [Pyrinomonadaceae bacterium]
GGREMRVLPAEMVRKAASRVKERRASVPQPWLGARGGAVAQTPLKLFTARGWSPKAARQVSNRQSGVLLTSVAPGTPAAVAGLRPGDVVARISELEVRGVEDMTLLIKELGGNSIADFTVFRAGSSPLKLLVRLSESLNPVQDTARAEALAARLEVRGREEEARHIEIASREALAEEKQTTTRVWLAQAEVESANRAQQPLARARLAKEQQRAASAQQRVEHERLRLQALWVQLAEARSRLLEAEARLAPFMSTRLSLPVKSLLPFGIEARPMAGAGMRRPGFRAGLVIISVRPDSAAAGLRVGDVIETLDNQPLSLSELQHDALSDASGITLGVRREQQQLTIKLLRQSSPSQ